MQPTKGPRLGGSPAHQRLILANLATALFEHGRITTTEAKARRLRPYAERLITKAKRGDLHNRREIQKVIRDRSIVHRLITDIGPFFADRDGGYTRITKTLPRKGDNAPMAVIELVQQKTVTNEAERARRVAATQRESTQRESTQRDSTQRDSTQRDSTQRDSTQRDSTQRDSTQRESTRQPVPAQQPTESEAATDAADAADDAADRALDAAVAADEASPGSETADNALDAAEAARDAADATAEAAEESSSTEDAPYGEGSHAPLDDASQARREDAPSEES